MGSEENHYEVRDMLIRFQNLNQTSFQPFLTSVNSATIQEHISSMLLPNKWGTHIEILAAATIYQVPVYCCVHSPVPSDYVAPHWVCVKPVRPKEKSFSYPNLAGSSLEDVPSPNHFELCYTKNSHYDSVVALDGGPCSEFPSLTSAVVTDTIVV